VCVHACVCACARVRACVRVCQGVGSDAVPMAANQQPLYLHVNGRAQIIGD
jgi:hypothetical protein